MSKKIILIMINILNFTFAIIVAKLIDMKEFDVIYAISLENFTNYISNATGIFAFRAFDTTAISALIAIFIMFIAMCNIIKTIIVFFAQANEYIIANVKQLFFWSVMFVFALATMYLYIVNHIFTV